MQVAALTTPQLDFERYRGRILLVVVPIVAPSQGAADAKRARLDAASEPALGIESLSVEFGMNMSIYPLDEPLPTIFSDE